MKSPDEIFDERCKFWESDAHLRASRYPVSERHHFADFLTLGRSCIVEVGKLTGIENLLPIHLDVIDNDLLNALADSSDGIGLIAVCSGAPMLQYDLFHRLLSHPAVLPQIGNANDELIGPQHQDGIVKSIRLLNDKRRSEGRSIEPVRPVHPNRLAFAQACSYVCSMFLIYHEIAHIAHGHIGFVHDYCGLPCLLELSARRTSATPLTAISAQAMEMDADNAAVPWSLNIVSAVKNDPDHYTPLWRPILSSQEAALYLWYFAMTVFFYLWGFDTDLTDIEKADHPPSGLRFRMLNGSAISVLNEHEPELAIKHTEIFVRGFRDALHSLGHIGGGMSPLQIEKYIKNAESQESTNHWLRLREEWNKLVPRIQPFSYQKKLLIYPPP